MLQCSLFGKGLLFSLENTVIVLKCKSQTARVKVRQAVVSLPFLIYPQPKVSQNKIITVLFTIKISLSHSLPIIIKQN